MRKALALMAVVALAIVLMACDAAVAGRGKQQRGGTRDRLRDCAVARLTQCLRPCADLTRDQKRDQDRDQDRLCDCGNCVDENGDGVCDNCDCPGAPQDGTGKQYRGGR